MKRNKPRKLLTPVSYLAVLPISTIPENLLKHATNHHTSRFEIPPPTPPPLGIRSDNLIHETKDFIELRGSPRPAVRAGSNLVGRGIANPMSERTRGFEMLLKGSTRFPLPAPCTSNLLVR